MIKKKTTKLTLSVETLRNLSEPDLQQVLGRATAICTNTATHACSGCNPCY